MSDHREGLPEGVVTLVFTDIEGSTRLLHELGPAYAGALDEHRRVLRSAFGARGGVEVDTQGDAFFYAFASARAAADATLDAHRGLAAGPLRVRIGVHTGEPVVGAEGYIGLDVHRAARIMAAAHGGQTVISQSTRDLLPDEGLTDLGEHRLKDLSAPQRLWQLGPGSFPVLRTLHQTNLPVMLTPLVGRQRELAGAADALLAHRLVTLTGPGGTGKTRLALQVAANVIDDYPDGVWWVPLASIDDPGLVMPTIGRVLGTPGDLSIALRSRRLLLVLDNLEQVIASASELAQLLTTTHGPRMLVTSREPLRIDGETEYPVEPLAADDAAALFNERARVQGATDAVREICRRLDQLPLAIELAAARTAVLEPEQLLARLANSLPLLTGGRRDVPERQRTLRATIQWSHDLLDDPERVLFRQLAVFADGFSLPGAEAVLGADADVLQSLVERSLVRRGHAGRFGMLETIRQFAAEELDRDPGADAIRAAHADHFLALAEAANPQLRGESQLGWLDELEREHGNLRAAASWALAEGRVDVAQRLCVALNQFWLYHSHIAEGRRLTAAVLAAASADVADPSGTGARLRAETLQGASILATIQSDWPAAERYATELLELATRIDAPRLVAQGHLAAGRPTLARGDAASAREHLELAIAKGGALGESWLVAMATFNLGYVSLNTHDFARARDEIQSAGAAFSELNDRYGMARSLVGLGAVAVHSDRLDDALDPLREGLALLSEIGDREGPAWAIELVGVALSASDADRAARPLGAAEALREELGLTLVESERGPHEGAVRRLESALDRQALAEAWSAGQSTDLSGAIALAISATELRNPQNRPPDPAES